MKKILILCLSLLMPLAALAQRPAGGATVSAVLVDALSADAVPFATVSLAKEGSDKPFKYALSADDGSFTIEQVRPGNYVLKAELLGYKSLKKNITVQGDLNLDKLKMDADREQLDAARVSAVGNAIIMKKDTIEFNASSFKTTDNDVLEDLLKKLPGVEISEDGSITSNGRTISKITIDGKTFFLDDPQLASKNIPAKMVNKLKVIDKKSDQAEFTGIDDGQEETIIDLNIKPGMMKGSFGNVMAGGGADIPTNNVSDPDVRYQAAAFIGNFKDTEQLSLVLNANNTNNRGFNDMSASMMQGMRGGGGGRGRGQGGWGSSNGITTSYMAGVNGAWTLCEGDMDLSGNYLYNHSDRDVEEREVKTTYRDGYSLLNKSEGLSNSISDGHRFGARLDHKFSKNTSILFEPRINFGTGGYTETDTTSTSTITGADTTRTNTSGSFSHGDNHNVTASGFLLFRQKLGAPGRTLTLMGRYNISNNRTEGINRSNTVTYDDPENPLTTTIDQNFVQEAVTYSLSGRATVTQPIAKDLFVEANYSYAWNLSTSDKATKDAFGAPVADFSNSIRNEYVNQEVGANLLYQKDGLRAQIGFAAKPTMTHNSTSNGSSYKVDTVRHTVNWAPQGMFRWEISKNANIRFFYRGESRQPSTNQLISVPDNTNPLSMNFGNPNLAPYFSNTLRGDFRYNNKKTFSSFNIRLEGNYVQDPIVKAMWDASGITYNMHLNGPSSSNVSANMFANVPLGKSKFTVSNYIRGSFSQSASYVAGPDKHLENYVSDAGVLDYNAFFREVDTDEVFEQNKTVSSSLMERLRVTYRDDNLEFIVSGRTRINNSSYILASVTDRTLTFNNQLRTSLNWTFERAGLTLKGEYNYNWFDGYKDKQPDQHVLNAEIQKLLFQKKFTLSLKGYDILGQSRNLTVTDDSNIHSESVNNTLGRYIILSLSYRFGTFDKSKMRGPYGGGMRH